MGAAHITGGGWGEGGGGTGRGSINRSKEIRNNQKCKKSVKERKRGRLGRQGTERDTEP